MPEDKLKKLEAIINLVEGNDNVKQNELGEILNIFVELLKSLKQEIEKKIDETGTESGNLYRAALGNVEQLAVDSKKAIATSEQGSINRNKIFGENLAALGVRITSLQDDLNVLPDWEEIRSKITEKFKKLKEEIETENTAEKERDRLETLQDDERLDKSAIKGLEELEKELRDAINTGKDVKVVAGPGGGSFVYIDGAKKGLLRAFNLKAGTGMTLTYSVVSGLPTITFASTGGGGFTKLTATGTRDGSNADFTFISEPSYIVSDGVWLTKLADDGVTAMWTWNSGTLTATMANPPVYMIFGVA